MNDEVKTVAQMVGEIAKLAFELNAPDYHVFFDYSGHVSLVSVRVAAGGWQEGKSTEEIAWSYTEGERNIEFLHDVIAKLKSHHEEWRSKQ